jgi:hypothetical protein
MRTTISLNEYIYLLESELRWLELTNIPKFGANKVKTEKKLTLKIQDKW